MSNKYISKLETGESQERDLSKEQATAVKRSSGDVHNGANNRSEPPPIDNIVKAGSAGGSLRYKTLPNDAR